MFLRRLCSQTIFMLICVFFIVGCEKKVIIQNVDQKEANEILVILASKEISAEKVEAASGGAGSKELVFNIMVDPDKAMNAMAILNKYGLPRKKELSLLNLFSGDGLVPSEQEQKIRYQEGLNAQIASTIRKIDGVIDADVKASFPKEAEIGSKNTQKQKVTASVFIKHDGSFDDPNTHLITKVKRLVASSIEGLDFEDVTIISVPAKFSNITLESLPGALPESEKNYAQVWGITVEKTSLTTFRILFAIFLAMVILLFILLAFVLKKISPLLKAHNLKYRQLLKKDSLSLKESEHSKGEKAPKTVEEYSENFEDEDNQPVYEDEDEDEDEDETPKKKSPPPPPPTKKK